LDAFTYKKASPSASTFSPEEANVHTGSSRLRSTS
jgi:hypothetical protein